MVRVWDKTMLMAPPDVVHMINNPFFITFIFHILFCHFFSFTYYCECKHAEEYNSQGWGEESGNKTILMAATDVIHTINNLFFHHFFSFHALLQTHAEEYN